MRIKPGLRGKKVVKTWSGAKRASAAAKSKPSAVGAALARVAESHTRTLVKLGALSVIGLIVLADFGSWAFARHRLSSDCIQVTGNVTISADRIREHLHGRLTRLGQTSLLTADLGGLARWLEMRMPAFASVEIASDLEGGALRVSVSERRAVAKLAVSGAELYLGDDGVVFPVYVRYVRELPLVTGLPSSEAAAGRSVTESPAGAHALAVLNAMSPLIYNLIEQIQINNVNYFDLKLNGGTVVKIDPATFVARQAQLEKLLKTRSMNSLAYVDLRFDRVVFKDRLVR